ncbi:MarR family transcriptional regulator [Novosphingobium sp. FSY-8]|uniref:MarR family transcriptional regulator n=1 Tax=Novosphingobium ovatum TaxID=1908523 RepID=A0ABW9XC05_9SPHN|nr:MarR family transcriptional regulator [Novosphingobium ovatum]NBC36054.1 MarR family transcriptional regulator [Novosphingobium ovatum]
MQDGSDQDIAQAPLAADPLAVLPGYALRRAANVMMAELSARMADAGLRVGDASVLLLVEGRNDMTSSLIGKALDIQRANMVRLLARMESLGLVTRAPIDRKSIAVVLTPLGAEALEQARAIIQDFEEDLMARIPARHRDHFLPALNALWQ